MKRLLAIIAANGGLGSAPQPAGRHVVDWYKETNPTPEDMLHVIAHALDAVQGSHQIFKRIAMRTSDHPDDTDEDRKRNLHHAESWAESGVKRTGGEDVG